MIEMNSFTRIFENVKRPNYISLRTLIGFINIDNQKYWFPYLNEY